MNETLTKLVAKYLDSHRGERLTISEIALGLVRDDQDRFAKKEAGLGSREALLNQLTREIYARRAAIVEKYPAITTDASRSPLRLFIEGTEEVTEPDAPIVAGAGSSAEVADTEETRRERDLYAPLGIFLHQALGVVSLRINESTSSNRRGRHGNRWLHPDVVGMLAPGQDWEELVRQCSNRMPTRRAELISLEVKLRLTPSTVREAFFQAVSNSLWANRAYLVATEVKGEDTLAELTTLCGLHGVGYIALDADNPAESRILIQAREREEVDWASANRIAQENADFRQFLEHVLNYLQTGQVVRKLWDS